MENKKNNRQDEGGIKLIYYIRERLLQVLKYAYPDKFDEYKKFYIELTYREVNINCKYNYEKKKILLNNLSRTSGDIFISLLFQLAKHIDIIDREETHNDRIYFMIVRKLLNESINKNLITFDDLKKYSDSKMKKALQETFSSFENWKFNVCVPDDCFIYIYVFESFMIRNILKEAGYKYVSAQAVWMKKVKRKDFIEEQQFIDYYKQQAIFIVKGDNSFYIRPVYRLKLVTYSKSSYKLLESLEYRYDNNHKCWIKLIEAANLKQELLNIEKIPKQSISILSN